MNTEKNLQLGQARSGSIKESRTLAWFIRHLFQKRPAQIGGLIMFLLLFFALFGPVIGPYDPFEIETTIRLTPPNFDHPFGTDELGRDLLSRIIFGARYTVLIGLITVTIAASGGILLGLTAAYWGGLVDMAIMRLVDIMLSFPYILLILAVVAALGPSLTNAMIAVGIASIPSYARLIRSAVLTVRETEYVEAARALGAPDSRIMFRTILPNIVSPIIVYVSLDLPTAVLSAASLSFLGLGAQPPLPEWGALMVNSRTFISTAPWVVAVPGLAIFVSIFGLNLFGNALRDILDPREQLR